MYKERVAALMNAVKDDPDDLEFIESRMNMFTDYVAHVTWMEIRMQTMRAKGIEGQEWRDAVSVMDAGRRSKHDVAMGGINQLNRMCQANGLELFYDGEVDHDHRTQIGDVIGDIVNEYFQGRAAGPLKQKDLMGEVDSTRTGKSFEAAINSMSAPDPLAR